MDPSARGRDTSPSRQRGVRDAFLIAASAVVAGAIVWFIAQNVLLSLIVSAVFASLGALWMWRTRRSGSPTTGTQPIGEERRKRGEYGPFSQPGASGFGTPGLGG